MNRIDRLQAILTTLQSKRIVTAESLAQKFEVSVRTIYRDIRSLEEGGVPIGAEAGIGYYIMEGYHLPPVMFTHEEARALLMAGKIVEQMTDPSTIRSFGDALTKINAVLDSQKKEEMEDLDAKIMVLPSYSLAPKEPGEVVLDKIKESLARSVIVSFDYFSSNKSEHSTREVEPLGLCYYGHYWHLIAYCLLRKDYRDFRVDRMTKFTIGHQRFKPSTHPSLKQYLDKLTKETPLERATISVKTDLLRYMVNSKYQMGFMKETIKGDYCEMEFATASIDYFARWLLTYGDKVKVVAPEILKKKIQETIGKLVHHHVYTNSL